MPVYNRTVDTRTSPKAGLRHTKSDTMQRKLDTEGWQKNAEMLADDAFADEEISSATGSWHNTQEIYNSRDMPVALRSIT